MSKLKVTLKVTVDSLYLREEPNKDSKALGVLYRDEEVTLIGRSDDSYWFNVEDKNSKIGWSSGKYLKQDVGITYPGTPWLEYAFDEIGTKEKVGSPDNPRIAEYLLTTNLSKADASNDETAWCSAFVNWCMEKAKYAGTDSALARSWLRWGKSIEKPIKGCIVVFSRSGSPVFGHVGFYLSEDSDTIKVLGGNQSNSVCIQDYSKRRVLGYRLPVEPADLPAFLSSEAILQDFIW